MPNMETESLALERLAELATHHGWTHEQTLWRIFNALDHQREPFDFATFLWGIDFVACEEGGSPMLDRVLPEDRDDDELYRHWKRSCEEARAYTVLEICGERRPTPYRRKK